MASIRNSDRGYRVLKHCSYSLRVYTYNSDIELVIDICNPLILVSPT